jgi:ABC-type transporter Mla subunit MlaD
MSRDQISQEYYIGKIVSVLIEHKKILETLISKVYELQKVSNQNADSIKSYLNTLYKYIRLVETYNNRLDELAKSFSENLKSLEPIVKGTDKNKPVLDRLEKLETWVAEEVERRQEVELKKQNLVFSTISTLLPTFVLVSITFLGGVLLDYILNYKAEKTLPEIITPHNNRQLN